MTLQEIVDGIKSDSQSGEIGNNADQTAKDIIRIFSDCRSEFWELNNWDWSKVDISVSVPAKTTAPIALDPTVGEVISLGVVGAEGELASYTEKEWRKWRKLGDTTDSSGNVTDPAVDTISGYVRRGRDSSGNLRLLFVPPQATVAQIEGEGKLRLSPARYAVADISTVLQLDYFPDEVQSILRNWAYGRFLDAIKDARAGGVLAGVQDIINRLKGTQRTDPAKDARTPPPDYIRFVNRKRGGRTVV